MPSERLRMSDDLRVGRQWVAKACNDLLDADNNLASEMVTTDTVCLHLYIDVLAPVVLKILAGNDSQRQI